MTLTHKFMMSQWLIKIYQGIDLKFWSFLHRIKFHVMDWYIWILYCLIFHQFFRIQSNRSYVTFQGNSEIWSHKTGGRLIPV